MSERTDILWNTALEEALAEHAPPLTDIREVETWWWRDSPQHAYGTTETLARRAQRIFGGHVEVIHQQVTTVTTTRTIPPEAGQP